MFFWPGALVYVLTRAANTCPICGNRIEIPRIRPVRTPPTRIPASGPAEAPPSFPSPSPVPVTLRVDTTLVAQNLRRIMVAAIVTVAGIGACAVIIVNLGGDEEDTNRRPTTAVKSAEAKKLAETALHAGEFVKWYLDQTTPLCEEYYGKGYCVPVVFRLKKAEPCGVMPDRTIEWPASLADGQFYFVRMHFVGGGVGYGQISSGARYNEIPDQATVFRCWNDLGIMQ